MPVFFGHRTAELLLEKQEIELLTPSMDQGLEHCWANRSDLANVDLSLLEGLPAPYDILVPSPAMLRKWEAVRCHLCQNDLPAGSFIEVARDVFVASPALCLVQRARELTLSQTVALGERFCGTYALDSRRKSGIRRRAPLAALDDLRFYSERCRWIRGADRVRRATSLMLENAASPMETITRMVYCLPRRLGGFGLPMPQMNFRKTLSPSAQCIANKPYIVIDLFWEDFDFGIEYQGKYAHSSYTSIAADIARQLAAEDGGIELQMITINQLRNEAQRFAVARKIASRIGASIPSDAMFLRDNQRLVDELIGTLNT